ncbi:MAG: hypothetical protein EA398_11060 [Deltaproteobacteria bacterium]|nr:MAG: hypothetical protein EA398_11060 [Deltaproteobacteria bacterium]
MRTLAIRPVLLLALAACLVLTSACGDDDPGDGTTTSSGESASERTSDPGGTSSGDRTGSSSGDPAGSTSPTAEPDEASCLEALASPGGVLLEDDEVALQPALAASDAGLWVGWTGPGPGESDLAPWFAPVDCADGRWWGATPGRLNEGTPESEGLPRLAASGDDVLAVWQRADGTENQVRMLLLSADGTPRWAEPRSLDVEVRGVSVAGRTWMPDVTALPDGGWAIAATGVDEDWGSFRTYVAILDAEANPVGPAWPVLPPAPPAAEESGEPAEEDPEVAAERERWHEAPTIAAGPGGALWVAWDARSSVKDDVFMAVLRPDGAGSWEMSAPQRMLAALPNPVGSPSFARVDHAGTDRMWLALSVFDGGAAAMAIDVTDPDAIGTPEELAAGQSAFRTRLVQVDGGAVLAAWQSRDSATSARGVIRTRWLTPTADGFAPVDEVEGAEMRDRTTHLVYPLALVAHGPNAVLSWTAGAPELGWRTSLRLIQTP